MRKISSLTVFLGLFLLCQTNAAQRQLILISDGSPKAVIVQPSKPSPAATEGARILNDHLHQISGAKLRIFKESDLGDIKVNNGRIESTSPTIKAETFIIIGEGKLVKQLGATSKGLGPGGILIRTTGNALILLGPDENSRSDPSGTRYAVTTFLEDVLGCRYLWPGEIGKVVPKSKTITVGPINIHFSPLLTQRKIRWSGYSSRMQEGLDRLGFTKQDFLQVHQKASATESAGSDWMSWHRMGGTLGLRTGDGTILPAKIWDRFLREHPEWFAMQKDGSRYFDPTWERPRLCKSNTDLIEAIAQEKIKELARNPGQKSISLMTQDGGSKAGFCMCTACKALDPPEGRPTQVWTYDHKAERTRRFDYVSLTDRMIYFYNAIATQVAKVYPDVLFTGQAYSIYRSPPLRHKLYPKIVIRFVHNTVHYANDHTRRQGMADWDSWADAASMIYWRPNSLLWGRHEGMLGIYVHKLSQDFKHITQNKCVATDFDSCMHHWATQGLNYYVLAKLHWNPDLDVDEVIDDYCRAGFGDASEVIKRYFLRIEQLTNETAAKASENERSIDVTEPFTPEVISELKDMLDKATTIAGEDKNVFKRIQFLRIGLLFSEHQTNIYRMLRLGKQRRLTDQEKVEAGRLLDKKWLLMKDIFKHGHFAINVTAMCWGEWWRFKRLGWTGPSQQAQKSVNSDLLK